VTFKIAADCKLGRGNLAYKSIRKMMATNKDNDALKSGVEPYAVSNMYLGPENGLRSGEAVMGWVTGTAGWLFRNIVENIAGVKAGYKGLIINPCLPSAWKEVTARREYRDAVYNIRILNPSGLQSAKLAVTVDGTPIQGNTLPDFRDNKEHDVVAEMK
jgi:cellobiose phosphorylase